MATEFDRAGKDCVVGSGSTEDNPTPTDHRTGGMHSILGQWRHWRLVSKLAAVVTVPVIFALVLGTLQVRSQIRESEHYAELDRVVASAAALRSTIGAVQEERTRAAEFLAQGNIIADTLQVPFQATDREVAASAATLREQAAQDPIVRRAYVEVQRRLDQLSVLRKDVTRLGVDPVITASRYTDITNAMLGLDRAITSRVTESELISLTHASHSLARVSEEMGLQQALVLIAITRDNVTADTLSALQASHTRELQANADFQTVASDSQRSTFRSAQTTPSANDRRDALGIVLETPPVAQDAEDADIPTSNLSPLMVSASNWNTDSGTSIGDVVELQFRADSQLHALAYKLGDRASNLAGLASVILLSALLVAAAIIAVIARQLLGSLAVLRNSALAAANSTLPRAVAEIRAGRRAGTIEQVPVFTTDEVGEVARAFDAVQQQAVSLASEQAVLRRGYSDAFVNISRRSQSLLERQLRLFEHLESNEEDPDHLATLFQLDHLATRMRRNNENLMVLSGSDLVRRFAHSTTPADLLRAAVSEIEHYPRVVVHPLSEVQVVAYACSDLVRMLAELLDNAANFSAPSTKVTVTSEVHPDGSLDIHIDDRGIGAAEPELAALNGIIRTDHEAQESTSRRMGLFVVSRLAHRHAIDVQLLPGRNGVGLRTTVSLRPDLLLGSEQPEPPRAPREPLMAEFDWAAAEHDATSHHPLSPSAVILPPELELPEQQRDEFSDPEPLDRATRNGTNGHHLESGADTGVIPVVRGGNGHRFGDSAPEPEPTEQAAAEVAESPPNSAEPASERASSSAWFRVSRPGEDGASDSVRWTAKPADGTPRRAVAEPDVPAPEPQEAEPVRETAEPTRAEEPDRAWNFTTDTDQQRAEQVRRWSPDEYTHAGLPRRTPRAHLLSGNAGDSTPTRSARDAERTRGRLSQFQRGAQLGRHHQNPPERHDGPPSRLPHNASGGGGLPSRTPGAHRLNTATLDRSGTPDGRHSFFESEGGPPSERT